MAAMALREAQTTEIETLIDARLAVAIPGLEHSMGGRMNAIIEENARSEHAVALGHGALQDDT